MEEEEEGEEVGRLGKVNVNLPARTA